MNKNTIKIIAEVAQGFEGYSEYAKLYVKAAAAAKADAVKFQLVYADELATPDYKYYELFKSLEMCDDQWQNIAKIAAESNIELIFDVFGEKGISLAEKLKVKTIKIHATDIINKRLLKIVSESNVNHIILGVGGAYSNEISIALDYLKNKEVILLFGFQAYPTLNSDNQINRLRIAKDIFSKTHSSIKIGFSDHCDPETNIHLGIGAMSIGFGAEVLEKHLTLSKNMKMEDYESALNPDEFLKYVDFIKECSSAIGLSQKRNDFNMSSKEKEYRKMIRRHVVAINPIQKGDLIKSENVTLKRTSMKNAATDISLVEGKIATTDISSNSPINL